MSIIIIMSIFISSLIITKLFQTLFRLLLPKYLLIIRPLGKRFQLATPYVMATCRLLTGIGRNSSML